MLDPFYSYEDAGEAAGNTLPDTPTAIACGDINLNPQTFAALDDEPLRKSEILATARMSAIHGCKQAGLLSIYSALRHYDKTMILTQVHLLEQHDGKSSPFIFANEYENLSL